MQKNIYGSCDGTHHKYKVTSIPCIRVPHENENYDSKSQVTTATIIMITAIYSMWLNILMHKIVQRICQGHCSAALFTTVSPLQGDFLHSPECTPNGPSHASNCVSVSPETDRVGNELLEGVLGALQECKDGTWHSFTWIRTEVIPVTRVYIVLTDKWLAVSFNLALKPCDRPLSSLVSKQQRELPECNNWPIFFSFFVWNTLFH